GLDREADVGAALDGPALGVVVDEHALAADAHQRLRRPVLDDAQLVLAVEHRLLGEQLHQASSRSIALPRIVMRLPGATMPMSVLLLRVSLSAAISTKLPAESSIRSRGAWSSSVSRWPPGVRSV